MSTQSTPGTERDRITTTVTRLATAADGDTVFRDVYLQRAAQLLSPVVDAARYRGSLVGRDQLERLLAQARAAVGREDWAQVRDLGTRADNLKHTLDAETDVMTIAATVYGAPTVALDPLSQGLSGSKRWSDPATALAEVRQTLAKLDADDPANHALYDARLKSLEGIGLWASPAAADEPVAKTGASPQQQAMFALERGDAGALANLAETMLGRSGEQGTTASERGTSTGSIRAPEVLGEPLPAACLPRASRSVSKPQRPSRRATSPPRSRSSCRATPSAPRPPRTIAPATASRAWAWRPNGSTSRPSW
jgi:hypothetical protein